MAGDVGREVRLASSGRGRTFVACVGLVAVGFLLGRVQRQPGAPVASVSRPTGVIGEQRGQAVDVASSTTDDSGQRILVRRLTYSPKSGPSPGSGQLPASAVPARMPASPEAPVATSTDETGVNGHVVATALPAPAKFPAANALIEREAGSAPQTEAAAPDPSAPHTVLEGIPVGAVAGAVDLRYRFRPDERLVYRARLHFTQTQWGGIPVTTVSTGVVAVVEVAQELESVLPDSRFRVGVTTRVLEPRLPLGDPMARPRHQAIVITNTGRLAERGAGARPVTGPQQPSQPDLLQPELAGRSIAIGESWFTDSPLPIEGREPTIRTQYRLETTDALMPGQTNPVAAIRISYSLVKESPFLNLEIAKESGGKLWIDVQAGRLLRQTTTLAFQTSTRGATGPHRIVGKTRIAADIELLRVDRANAPSSGDRSTPPRDLQRADRLTRR